MESRVVLHMSMGPRLQEGSHDLKSAMLDRQVEQRLTVLVLLVHLDAESLQMNLTKHRHLFVHGQIWKLRFNIFHQPFHWKQLLGEVGGDLGRVQRVLRLDPVPGKLDLENAVWTTMRHHKSEQLLLSSKEQVLFVPP